VNSRLTDDFVDCFSRLPDAVKIQARKNYRLWKNNPNHPGLHFKRIHGQEEITRCEWELAGGRLGCSKLTRSIGIGLVFTRTTIKC